MPRTADRAAEAIWTALMKDLQHSGLPEYFAERVRAAVDVAAAAASWDEILSTGFDSASEDEARRARIRRAA